ncbi:UNVERIFIED_CONTAM: hypothetical protein GTU68_010971, partial [Idotea baltica]|nr:hypothetical protein [Idotea baltica]
IYTILATLVALGVLVAFHEYGHFKVARLCGVKVLRFSIGFGAPLIRWKGKDGTEFVIALIPFGGYVKMLDEREAPVPLSLRSEAFNYKTVYQRTAIVAAGPLANFSLAVILFFFVAILGHNEVRPVIGSVAFSSPAREAGLKKQEEIVAVDGVSVHSWNAVIFQLTKRLGDSGALNIRVVSPLDVKEKAYQIVLSEWQKGVDEPDVLKSLGIKPWRPAIPAILSIIQAGSPADNYQLKSGDQILAINHKKIQNWQQAVEIIRKSPNKVVVVLVLRHNKKVTVSPLLEGRRESDHLIGYLGAGVKGIKWPKNMLKHIDYGPLSATKKAFSDTWDMSVLTVSSLKKILFGELSVKNLSGPISIAKAAGASAKSGLSSFLGFMAYLSVSLGVLNILPIPVLDGGHLLFYFIEMVRKRPLSDKIQNIGVKIGFSLVAFVMLLAIINDFGRL